MSTLCAVLLTVWKVITLGAFSNKELAKRVKRGCEIFVGRAEDFILDDKVMRVTPRQSNVSLVTRSLHELGFTEARVPGGDFMTREFCERWSSENLVGEVLELCEAQDAPHLRYQYADQPVGECLWFAMEGMQIAKHQMWGVPCIFYISREHNGDRCIGVTSAQPQFPWDSNHRFVFRLRKVS